VTSRLFWESSFCFSGLGGALILAGMVLAVIGESQHVGKDLGDVETIADRF